MITHLLPAFFGKMKVKPMQIAIKKEKFANAFSKFGEGKMSHEVFPTIEEYLCSVYGFKCDNSINEEKGKCSKKDRNRNLLNDLSIA